MSISSLIVTTSTEGTSIITCWFINCDILVAAFPVPILAISLRTSFSIFDKFSDFMMILPIFLILITLPFRLLYVNLIRLIADLHTGQHQKYIRQLPHQPLPEMLQFGPVGCR